MAHAFETQRFQTALRTGMLVCLSFLLPLVAVEFVPDQELPAGAEQRLRKFELRLTALLRENRRELDDIYKPIVRKVERPPELGERLERNRDVWLVRLSAHPELALPTDPTADIDPESKEVPFTARMLIKRGFDKRAVQLNKLDQALAAAHAELSNGLERDLGRAFDKGDQDGAHAVSDLMDRVVAWQERWRERLHSDIAGPQRPSGETAVASKEKPTEEAEVTAAKRPVDTARPADEELAYGGDDAAAFIERALAQLPTDAQRGLRLERIRALTTLPGREVPALLERLAQASDTGPERSILLEAIGRVAGPDQRATITAAYADQPDLVAVINEQGWGADILDAARAWMRDHPQHPLVPIGHASVVARHGTRADHELLTTAAGTGHNFHQLYHLLAEDDGFPMEQAVAAAWPAVQEHGLFIDHAFLYMQRGERAALDGLMEQARTVDSSFAQRRIVWTMRTRSSAPSNQGLDPILAWYDRHKKSIRFDERDRIFTHR